MVCDTELPPESFADSRKETKFDWLNKVFERGDVAPKWAFFG